jgi:hypothetical protein
MPGLRMPVFLLSDATFAEQSIASCDPKVCEQFNACTTKTASWSLSSSVERKGDLSLSEGSGELSFSKREGYLRLSEEKRDNCVC